MSGTTAIWSDRLAGAWRAWGLGVALALAGGATLFGLAALTGSYGYSLVLTAPCTLGFALGYAARFQRGVVVVVAVLAVVAVVGGLVFAGMGGVFCGLMFAAVAALPAVLGAVLGNALRERLDPSLPNPFVPLLLLVLTGGAMELERRLTPAFAPESVVTRRVLEAAPAEAWERLVFYEEVPMAPPLLARIGIPLPLGTEGRIARPGDVKLCRYSTGHLRKRVTDYRPARLLAFDVIEQVGVEDRSAELLRGSFRFAAAAGGGTEVTLTTTYRPLLQARLVWRPFERAVAHLLHEHVLDGMESVAAGGPVLLADSSAP